MHSCWDTYSSSATVFAQCTVICTLVLKTCLKHTYTLHVIRVDPISAFTCFGFSPVCHHPNTTSIYQRMFI